MKRFLVTCIIGAALSSTAYAKDPIDRREKNQRERIAQGIKSGELTRQEAKRLEGEEKRIRELEARARRDGDISRKEALHLDRALDRASKDIRQQKHDKQDRN